MIAMINIPNYEFDNDIKDKFQDYFNRVKADIADGTLCGNYELETTDMFLISFQRLQVLPDNATNGDMIKAMFPNSEIYTDVINEIVDVEICEDSSELRCSIGWWNAPYKRGDSDGSN